MRAAVRVIYAFARSADDIADEGDALPGERVAALDAYESALDRIDSGEDPASPLFVELAAVIAQYETLDTRPLRDLLSAFRQDVAKTRYANWDELRDYCRRSADPVGRIMLALHGERDPALLQMSDAICSALQVINFLQDVAIDWQKARVYLPQEDLQRFGVSEAQIAHCRVDAHWQALMQYQVDRARALMLSGAPLARRVTGRLGWELRLIVLGGLRILEKIEASGHDVFHRRPKLGKADWLLLGWRSLRFVG
jgi:squalene synthase HpnC